MNDNYETSPSDTEMNAILREETPGLEWQISEDRHDMTFRLRARRKVELLQGTIGDEIILHKDSAMQFIRELIEKARRKAIEDYGLTTFIEAEREEAARKARAETLSSLRTKLNTYREQVDAIAEDGSFIKVRGPLPRELAEIFAWASGDTPQIDVA
jgi:hypothetical protein